MTRAERRHRTEKVVRKRMRVAKQFLWTYIPGKLKKFNMRCGCPLCRDKPKKPELRLPPS